MTQEQLKKIERQMDRVEGLAQDLKDEVGFGENAGNDEEIIQGLRELMKVAEEAYSGARLR